LLREGSDREAVGDPYFTPCVARAIARSEVPGAVLEWFREQNPVALVAAVPYLEPSPSAYADRIVQLARAWLEQPGASPASMRRDALWTIAGQDRPGCSMSPKG
jgi:hypothetical protein